jgi:ribosomal protein S12 methylthiotransferase accessory factor
MCQLSASTRLTLVPAFLIDPHYPSHKAEGDSFAEYRSLLRNSSGLGTGASTSRVEATLHALCELVEHDSLSIALLRWYLLGQHDLRVVRGDSLPHELARLLRRADAVTKTSVRLLDITSDLGIPSYIAVSEGCHDQPTLVGMGVSPIASQAAYRSVDELTQSVTFSHLGNASNPVLRLAPWPVLQQCGCMHISGFSPSCVTEVDLRASASATTPDVALNSLIAGLHRQGFECYFRDLTPNDSEISVVAALVPGLERFSLVRLGVPVLPNGRGWGLWGQPTPRHLQQQTRAGVPRSSRPARSDPKTPRG